MSKNEPRTLLYGCQYSYHPLLIIMDIFHSLTKILLSLNSFSTTVVFYSHHDQYFFFDGLKNAQKKRTYIYSQEKSIQKLEPAERSTGSNSNIFSGGHRTGSVRFRARIPDCEISCNMNKVGIIFFYCMVTVTCFLIQSYYR